MSSSRIAVIGNGSWATALVKLLSNNLKEINWHIRKPDDIAYISQFHRNPRYISSVEFTPGALKLFPNAEECIQHVYNTLISLYWQFLRLSVMIH
jgi:glycerol-3-phosphate dehydrogenase (NAD(P)+)